MKTDITESDIHIDIKIIIDAIKETKKYRYLGSIITSSGKINKRTGKRSPLKVSNEIVMASQR